MPKVVAWHHDRMTNRELLTTTQLASRLGISRQAVLGRVRRGTLKPYRTLANGHHLFKLASA